MVGAAFARRFDDFLADLQKGVAITSIQVIVLNEHGGRQNYIRRGRGLGHKLLMHAHE